MINVKMILIAVLLAILAVSANASVVYEGFDYTEGTVITSKGTATDGWAGAWTTAGTQQIHIVASGLDFSPILVSGGAAQRPLKSGYAIMSRQISAASQTALTADGTTTWFSVVMNPGSGANPMNTYSTLILGDAELIDGGGGWNAQNIAAGGNAIGVGYAGNASGDWTFEDMRIQGVTYKDGVLNQNVDQRIIAGGGNVLIVGKVDWAPNGTNDVVSLYHVSDLAAPLPEAFSTMSVDLDQATFNVFSIACAQRVIFDEIRFGTSYEDVILAPMIAGAGDDMVSWDGAEVQLNPTIIYTGDSTVTSSWTADLPSGVQAVFNPDIYAVDPVVTFTKASYSNATIINASFEDPALGEGLMTANNNVPGWVAKNASVYDPNTPLYGGIAPDGENVVRVNNTYDGTDKYVYQVVNETLQAGATYTLNVSLGVDYVTGTVDPNSTDPDSTDYKVELLAGTDYVNAQVLAGEVGHYSDINDYKEVSVAYTYNEATDAALIGQPLQIRLTCVYGTNGSERGAIFDNVELTSSSGFPAPEVATAGLTLTVEDGVLPIVSDSMTVDIYDDACTATIDGLNFPIAASDLNGDCVTNLEDFAAMAKAWLEGYAIDVPQSKP